MNKIPGKSRLRDKGILKVPRYLRVPYSMITSEDFLALEPLANKILWLILRDWKTNDPDKGVELSFAEIRRRCPKRIKSRTKGKWTTGYAGFTQITRAINQLERFGFIIVERRYKQINRYWIGQKWFTGENR